MLKQLSIKNVALIDTLQVDLSRGLNVLSGETGAGKSIIIDSLSFVLGGKFDKNLIRSGEKSAFVSAYFDKISQDAKNILRELGMDESDDILLSREAGDKNEYKINGQNVTLSMLKQISSSLVDIHSQGENQRILSEKNQLEILDNFCGEDVLSQRKKIAEMTQNLSSIKSEIENIGGNRLERERSLDFLKFEVKEIEEAKIKENEDEILAEEKTRMLAGEKICSNLDYALSEMEGSISVPAILSDSMSHLLSVSQYDSEIEQLSSRLKSCKIELNDIIETIKEKKDSLNFNQFEFDKIDARLDKIKALKKKYGATTSEIFEFLEKAKAQIDEIENSSEILEKLEKEKLNLEAEILKECESLSERRKQFAAKLENLVCRELDELAMKNAKFKISFAKGDISKTGFDSIQFLFSANAGQDEKPLGKIISGGEMSRFCLALKNITVNSDSVSTMVFDEIDTGISGKVAEVVAEKMVKISRNNQCLAITHLPQIVAMADYCIKVEKQSSEGKTTTKIEVLDEGGHAQEVARLIGSAMSSLHAGEHAKDLIEFGKNFKKSLVKE